MSIFKQWYLRLFKGFIKTDSVGKAIIEIGSYGWSKKPQFIELNSNSFLVGPPV